MRQLNFILIFALCLAIALFSIENVQFVTIRVVPGLDIQAPLAIALILTLGVGAAIAWMFGLWHRLHQQLAYHKVAKEVKEKTQRIEVLEQEIKGVQAELEQQKLLPSTANSEQ
jgi:putative membrane protein